MASAVYLVFEEIESPDHVRAISERIRDMMEFGKMKENLITLKKQSDLLCAYLFSREAEARYGDRLAELRRVAMVENARTAEAGNAVGTRKKWDVRFMVWGASTYGPRYPPADLAGSGEQREGEGSPGGTTPPA